MGEIWAERQTHGNKEKNFKGRLINSMKVDQAHDGGQLSLRLSNYRVTECPGRSQMEVVGGSCLKVQMREKKSWTQTVFCNREE